MTTSVLGIDISKAKFDVALLQADQYQLATFDNDPQGFDRLARWLRKRRVTQLHACMEATGAYGDRVKPSAVPCTLHRYTERTGSVCASRPSSFVTGLHFVSWRCTCILRDIA